MRQANPLEKRHDIWAHTLAHGVIGEYNETLLNKVQENHLVVGPINYLAIHSEPERSVAC